MNVAREDISFIIEAGVKAPSGDNSQPWRFEVDDNKIYICNVSEKDTSLFNTDQISNYIAIGAVAVNMQVACTARNYHGAIEIFPDSADKNRVIGLTLTEGDTISNLCDAITSRATNRRAYSPTSIPSDVIHALTSVSSDETTRIAFATDDASLQDIAFAVSGGEKITLQEKNIHSFLFSHITWNKEDDQKRHGFYIKTFEFKPPQEIVFKLLSNWNILRFFDKFGISQFIANNTRKIYATSPAFGAIICKDNAPESFVKTGMNMEQVWLTATTFQLGLQPTTTIPLLHFHIENKSIELSEKLTQLLKERYAILQKRFNLQKNEHISFLFRIGYAEQVSARTTRFDPHITYV